MCVCGCVCGVCVRVMLCKARDKILSVVLYGCETWSLTFNEERKLRVFENMVLRRILGIRGTR